MNSKEEALWVDFKDNGSEAARVKLIEMHMPVVEKLANKVFATLPNSVEFDDLIQFGSFGLMDSIERFDLSLGWKFETYASIRIKGSIIDGLRSEDWVPRAVRLKARDNEDFQVAKVTAIEDHLNDPLGIDQAFINQVSDSSGQENISSKIARAIGSVDERESVVLALYYFDGCTLSEIGDVLGVTKSRVSQIHSKVVTKLYESLF